MITNQLARQDVTGNGTAGPFSFQFMIQTATDLAVYVDGNLKSLTTHYTVSGAGSESGFSITFTTGNEPASLAKITAIRQEAYTQTLDLQRAGNFPSASAEAQWDKEVRLMQQIKEMVNRAPVLSVPDSRGLGPIVLGAPSIGKYLRWDAAGQNIEAATPTTIPSGLPVGGNYDHLTVNGSGAVTWGQEVYNFATNYLNVSKYASLSAAVAAIGATPATLLVSTPLTVTGNLTIPETLRLQLVGGSTLIISDGHTLTLTSPAQVVADHTTKIFIGPGSVAFSRQGVAPAEWWGAKGDNSTNSAAAINAALASFDNTGGKGAAVDLNGGTYVIGTTTLTMRNRVHLRGRGKRVTILNYSGTGTAVDCLDMDEGGGLEGLRLHVGTSTTAVGLNIRNSAADVMHCRFADLEILGTVGTAGQIGIQSVTSGGHIISENYFGDIKLRDIARPIVRTGTEGNNWDAIQVGNYGNGAGAIALDSTSHAEQTTIRVAGVQGSVSSPVAYKEQGSSNITSLVADIGPSPARAINFVGIRNCVFLSRPLNNTPIGTADTWNSVIDQDAAQLHHLSARGNVPTTVTLSAGWGTTATVTAISGNDNHVQFTVNSAGTGQAASPTINVHVDIDGVWPTAPHAIVARGLGNQMTVANAWTTTTSTVDITFLGTPVAGETYRYNIMVLG